jgi:YD repeat-containing protein
MQLWIWPVGGTKPATPVSVPKLANTAGVLLDGHFVFNWSGLPAGNYNYEFRTLDNTGKELDHVQGQMNLGTLTVTSKTVDTLQPVPTSNPLANSIVRSQTYNAFGEVDSETDGRLNVTNLYYDQRGNLVRKEDPLTDVTQQNGAIVQQRPVTQYYYDSVGRVLGQLDANNNPSSQQYDAAGHRVAEFHADGGKKDFVYDVLGNVVVTHNEIGEATTYSYDLNHQLIRIDRPTGPDFGSALRYDTYLYDEAGRRILHTNALGNSELTFYDDIGRVKETRSLGNVRTTYSYNYAPTTGGTTTITTMADGTTLEDTANYFGKVLHH